MARKASSYVNDSLVSCHIHDIDLSHEGFQLVTKLPDPIKSECFKYAKSDSISCSCLFVAFLQLALDIFEKKPLLLR